MRLQDKIGSVHKEVIAFRGDTYRNEKDNRSIYSDNNKHCCADHAYRSLTFHLGE